MRTMDIICLAFEVTCEVFGIGIISVCFHDGGTSPSIAGLLKITVIGEARMQKTSLRFQSVIVSPHS